MAIKDRTRSALYLAARDELKRLDPNLGVHALSQLARAVVDRGIAFRNRDGRVIFDTTGNITE